MNNKFKMALLMQGGRGWLGGSEYIKNLILALGSLPEEVRSTFEIHLISGEPLNPELQTQLADHVTSFYHDQQGLAPKTFPNRSRWYLTRKLFKIADPRFDDFIKQQKFDFIYPLATKQSHHYRSAAWIPDFQHKYLPQFFTAAEIQSRDQSFRAIAENAKTVVLSSKTAAEDFKKFFPEAAEKARVLSFKTSPSPSWYEGNPEQIQQKYNLPDRFFLISNQFWQHKNHLLVFEALKILKNRGLEPTVVCTGHIYDYRKPEYSDTLLSSIHCSGIAHQVRLLGLIPKLDQVHLMRRSLAVLQPSLFEGWSTLVEDARSLGKAMILSDLPVNLEQSPPHSVFFDRTFADSLAQQMEIFWAERKPGPDIEAESQALKNIHSEIQSYGYRFLEIAKEII
jgi:glycosyltransferase involved in cell wall biosynthesis